ncbi:hypothetical protein Tco_0978163 [Tanacetum coccineum]|uniref:CCHC-type domain-containing protein n=1 Tax=Tanacetum coccineum TaxID=301880 RepID=A0ABQ5EM60_9ASTR
MSSYNHPGCSYCGGPFNGGNCPSCSSVGSGNEFVYDPNPYSYNETPSFFNQPPQHQYETYSCEFCGNDAHYGYDCPPQVPFVYNQDPCFNQNFDNFPQTSPSLPQYLCCTRCGGPHETFQCDQLIFDEPYCENCGGPHMSFQCQPMNHCYNPNSFGFDQSQPPQFPVIHQPPQETSVEILQARENLMKSIQNFLKKFDRICFRETPKVLLLAWEKFFEIKHACGKKHHQPEDIQDLLHKLLKDVQVINDDDEYTIQYREYLENLSNAITPDLSTEEPDNSLSMGDEHLSTIPKMESDKLIKSSVENLVPIPSDSEGISNDTCDVPFCNNSPPLDVLNDDFKIFSDFNDDCTSSDDDSFENINYVEASPPDSELVSLEEVKDDILREKLLNIYLLIAKIESLNDNPTPDCVLESPSTFPIPVEDSDSFFKKSDTSLSYSDNSLPEFKTFSHHTEETSSGSTTTHADNSLPEYDSFLFEIEPDQGELTSVVIEDFLGEPRVPNVLPNHPTLYLDSDFAPSDDSLKPDLVVFSFRTRNKIIDQLYP